ncbi:MAG: glycosyltransferase [Acidobacteria bacterium]|nr:glycosyltransferase [Acidobacteriota bacterium]
MNDALRVAVRSAGIATPVSVIPAFLPPSRRELGQISPGTQAWLDEGCGEPLLSAAVYRVLPPAFGGTDVYGLGVIEGLARCLQRSGTRFRLAIMIACRPEGAAEEAFLIDWERRVRALIGERLHIALGEQAPPIIARSDVFLRPTTADGDSVSVREAASTGVSVVASDAAARPAGTFLFPVGDVAAFDVAVRDALRHEKQCSESSGESGVDAVIRIYESVLASESA